jgi:2-polyprenyl-3-methyl-5-hydroxy-6-metoxy-1,4-benzoquinol methylase
MTDLLESPLRSLIEMSGQTIKCPCCGGMLVSVGEIAEATCDSCELTFGSENGIPQLFWANEWGSSVVDITARMKAFYEATPFPNYDEVGSAKELATRAHRRLFAHLIDAQIPDDAVILDVGCGTGQLSNFLGLRPGRKIYGTDMCMNSLALGEKFRRQNGLSNVSFLQMNLFRPVFEQEMFDYVISSGVLHHTSDPHGGFITISALVKHGGFTVIGLYNKLGRIPLNIRKVVMSLTGGRVKLPDPQLNDRRLSELRKHVWFMDQYKNPHESSHTMDEVLKWFEEAGISFTNSFPSTNVGGSISDSEILFEPRSPGTRIGRFLVQLGMMVRGGREGGFFLMFGRREP